MGFFSGKPTVQVSAILDIGSKSVGGAIFTTDSSGKPKLLYTAREPIAFQKVLTGESLLAAMLKSLNLVLFQLEKYGIEHLRGRKTPRYRVRDVVAVVSSPWHSSETKVLRLAQAKPFIVTKAMVENLLATEEKIFEESLSGDGGKSPFTLLEHKVVEIRLNGYPTGEPYGKKATTLEMSLFATVAPLRTADKIKKAVLARFPQARLEFHTFSLASFASLRDFFADTENFLIVQVGGDITDITIVKKGVIAETITFPAGHNTLLRSLDRICGNHPFCTLEALIALHGENKVNSADCQRVERAIADTGTAWLKFFNEAISNFSEETFLPKTVFLFEDDSYAPLFEEFLEKAESNRFTVTAESFEIKNIGRTESPLFADNAENSRPDAILGLAASFSARVGKYAQ